MNVIEFVKTGDARVIFAFLWLYYHLYVAKKKFEEKILLFIGWVHPNAHFDSSFWKRIQFYKLFPLIFL